MTELCRCGPHQACKSCGAPIDYIRASFRGNHKLAVARMVPMEAHGNGPHHCETTVELLTDKQTGRFVGEWYGCLCGAHLTTNPKGGLPLDALTGRPHKCSGDIAFPNVDAHRRLFASLHDVPAFPSGVATQAPEPVSAPVARVVAGSDGARVEQPRPPRQRPAAPVPNRGFSGGVSV